MRIQLVTPAPPGSRSGNRVTALRWARHLRALGHRVEVGEGIEGRSPGDLLIALHARKSSRSIDRFPRDRPVVVALTGTDIYGDVRHPVIRRSLERADRLVVLQERALAELPAASRAKARVILQSAQPLSRRQPKRKRTFDVLVVGHLRRVKDPFRAALASRKLSSESRIRVLHVGAALTEAMATRAERLMKTAPRYRWLGEQPRWKVRGLMARSHLLVLSSLAEGGANVVSEAVVAGLPVVASNFPRPLPGAEA